MKKRPVVGAGISRGDAAKRPSEIVLILALGAIVLLAYANSFTSGFCVDSRFILQQDPRIRQISAANLQLVLTRDYWFPTLDSGLYRPVTTLSYMLNDAVLGHPASPAGYHAANLLLHWANVVLMYALMRRLALSRLCAFFAAALFGVHPLGTEAVTNIVGRADLLAATAVLGGVLIHTQASASTGRARALWLGGLAAVASGGLLAKESVIVLPAVMLLFDLAGDRSFPAVAGYAAAGAGFLVSLGARLLFFGRLALTPPSWLDNPLVGAGFWPARLTAVKVLGSDLLLLLWPKTLSCDYSFNQIPIVGTPSGGAFPWDAALALIALAGILVASILISRRSPAAFFLICFSLVAALPTSNLLVLIGSIKAERFLYLPLVGFAGGLAMAIFAAAARLAPGRRLFAPAILSIVALALGARTIVRNFDWADNLTIWSEAARAAPDSFKTHQNLALELFTVAYASHPDFQILDRAIQEGERSLEIYPDNIEMLMSLGGYYLVKGDTLASRGGAEARSDPGGDARQLYERGRDTLQRALVLERAANEEKVRNARAAGSPLSASPVHHPAIYQNLASAHRRLSQDPASRDAIDVLLELTHIAPGDVDTWLSLGDAQRARAEALLRLAAADAAAAAHVDLSQAAVAFTAALLLDAANQDAQALLPAVYRLLDPGGCAVAGRAGEAEGKTLDPACPRVRADRCEAWAELSRLVAETGAVDRAEEMRKRAMEEDRCSPASLMARPNGAS